MKKIFVLFMVLSSLALEVFAIPLDTTGWIDNSNIIQCEAVELEASC